MDRRFLGILGAIVIIFIVIFAVVSGGNSNNSGGGSSNAKPTSHMEGQGKAGVTLVEYGDYECPICAEYYQPLKDAVSKYSDQIHFQFRNLPLVSVHPNAFAAARAAEAAGLQNKYWQMHDKLYENQSSWAGLSDPKSTFDQYAGDIDLNVTKFDADYTGSQVNSAINGDLDAFKKTHLEQATPTFFLDGKAVSNGDLIDKTGQPSADKIGTVLKAEIDKKTQASKQ
ncbi:MAG TPA: thioredoxin domain-containing protein [Candidatus Saccharimonadales bacterium]|nr:thioredoxin domain-containing protein [Candidatus Saccharimonadales bacterium]